MDNFYKKQTFIAMFSAFAERAETLVGPVLDDGALGAFGAGVATRCAG